MLFSIVYEYNSFSWLLGSIRRGWGWLGRMWMIFIQTEGCWVDWGAVMNVELHVLLSHAQLCDGSDNDRTCPYPFWHNKQVVPAGYLGLIVPVLRCDQNIQSDINRANLLVGTLGAITEVAHGGKAISAVWINVAEGRYLVVKDEMENQA